MVSAITGNLTATLWGHGVLGPGERLHAIEWGAFIAWCLAIVTNALFMPDSLPGRTRNDGKQPRVGAGSYEVPATVAIRNIFGSNHRRRTLIPVH